MRSREFLLEAEVTLNPAKLIKDMARFNNLIANIINGKPLYQKDGTPVIIKKTEAKRLKDLYNQGKFAGSITLLGADMQSYPLGSFLKTSEYGGQSVPPGIDTGEVSVANIKPGQVFQHGNLEKGQTLDVNIAVNLGAFPAPQLGQKIITNAFLDGQGRVGQAVKQIAKEIENEVLPVVPDLTDKELNNIQNYGFEYLGVQELVKGIADFPNSQAFYNHVGVDISNLILYFPQSSGNPLQDSYALVNKATENNIGISSKGAKGGAPSSINGLKLSDEMMKLSGKDPAITFINLIQKTEPWKQPFVAVNWIQQRFPGNLGTLEQFLPLTDDFLVWCKNVWDQRRQGVPVTLEEIPRKYRGLYKVVQSSIAKRKDTELFYDVRYFVKDALHNAIKSNVIPNFNERMLELLGENFVVLKTEKISGRFVTRVHWPSKVGGTITFEHKDPAPKWTSSITWKLN
jgi:hypothetical protein